MNPKLVAVLVAAALLTGLLIGAGGGILGTTFFYRFVERSERWYDAVPQSVAVPQPVVEEAPVEPDAPPPLAPGQRALTIKLGKDQAVQGFLMPGSRVDVQHRHPAAERQERMDLIAQNVQVLAVNLGGDETVLVTLALTPEQAEDLTKAQADGTLSLTLRK